MDTDSKDSVFARLDRLTDMVTRRLDKFEERLRALEQDNGEIINLLIAVKAGLEECSGELMIETEEVEIELEDGPAPGSSLH